MPISDSFVQTFSYSFRAFEATGEFQNLIAAEEVRVQSLTVVTHCNTLQHTATHCNTLQHTATHCNTLQHTAEATGV
jgi:hypothetical protein